MPDKQVRIDLAAKDDASKTIDNVADNVEDLEKLDPEIEITADDKASGDIKALKDDAEALSRTDAEVILKARADAAKAELAALRADLKTTEEAAQDTGREMDRAVGGDTSGIKTRGNAIADLTGPLGEASGAASDFAGVFDGIGDIAEDVAGKIGLSASAAGAVSGAIGGIGIAVAAAAAVWTMFKQRQEEAKKKAEELRKKFEELNKAISGGDTRNIAEKFLNAYEDAFKAGEKAKVPFEDILALITGQADNLPTVTGAVQAYDRQIAALKSDMETMAANEQISAIARLSALESHRDALVDVERGVRDNIKAGDDATAAEKAHEQQIGEVETALRNANRAQADFGEDGKTVWKGSRTEASLTEQAFDRLRGSLDMEQALLNLESQVKTAMEKSKEHAHATDDEILGIKQSIIDVAEAAGLTPIEVQSLISNVTPENVADVVAWAQSLIEQKGAVKLQAEIQAAVDLQMKTRSVRVGPLTPDNERVATSSTQIINFPRGMSVDAAMQLARSQSRNGRYYQGAGR